MCTNCSYLALRINYELQFRARRSYDFSDMFTKGRKIASGEGETSSAMSKNDYEVFLSFRGPDTRQGFTDCLYHAMVDAGIHVFRDDDELRPGDKIVEILQAIDHSKICIVVLSRTFAVSEWCLREIERIVKMKKDIVPVYYDVTFDDVKLKTQLYDDALTVHETKYEKEQVQQWREALKEIPRFKGKELKNSGFVEFIRQLVKEVLTKLKLKHKYEIKYLVEVPDEVEVALKLLDIGSGGRRFLGIHGMGGIGKTTLAKIIFNQISGGFDCSCFLENIREYSSQGRSGVHCLQELLLKSLDPSLRDATKLVDPMKRIQVNFQRKKVFIVLDDIYQTNHIDSLVGDSSWFGTGSRIIFTTRNTRFHEQEISFNAEFYGLEKREMDSKQALELFSKHAFGEAFPPEDYKDLSNEAISTTGGLPLALEVVGSFLHRQKAKVWRSTISKLKEMPDQAVQQKLKLSYDSLEFEQQEIFLDIACFFIGKDKTNAVYMWEGCGFHPDHGIEVLISTSLIKIKNKKYFWMHDQLRDIGRAIVKENSKDPRAGSRLWMHKDALGLLKRNSGKEKIEGLHLDRPAILDRADFVGLEKLRFLRLTKCANFSGDFTGLIPKLRWLSLLDASSFNATNVCLEELAVLHLSSCRFDETWPGWSQILISENLKALTLWGCSELISTPDLSKLVNLERLVLHRCKQLTSIHSSVGKLQCLKRLTLTKCYALHELPKELTSLEGLKHFIMEDLIANTSRFDLNIPESLGRLICLTTLELCNGNVSKLPNSIGELVKLKRLSLFGCAYLKVLPDSIGGLRLLVSLNLSLTGITKIPTTIGRLAKLESLWLSGCRKLERLPNSIGNLHSLVELNMDRSSIIELPDSLTNLAQLKYLDMEHSNIERIPDTFGALTSLEKLLVMDSKVRSLPDSVRGLEKLEVLTVGSNKGEWIEELHELPIGLTKLRIHRVRKIPNLANLINLSVLMITDDENGQSSEQLEPLGLEGIEKLNKLKFLYLEWSNVKPLPAEFSALQQLHSLELYCTNSELMPPQLPSSLSSLVLHVKPGAQPPINLSNLKKLSNLELFNFVIEVDGLRGLGVEGLESLEVLNMHCCNIEFNDFPVLNSMRYLCLRKCHSPMTLLDISRLDRLVKLKVDECNDLVELPGIGKLKFLTKLEIRKCGSLRRIEDLSEVKGLKEIMIYDCGNFLGIDGIDRLLSAETVYVSIIRCKCQDVYQPETFPASDGDD